MIFQWFYDLPLNERRTFIAAFAGWSLDALDFMVFTFVISSLMTYFQIDKAQAGMLGTVTLLFSALGGWIAGMLADRYGRVRILQLTIFWFSVCTFLIGFTQTFDQIIVLRALQGLGFGGEWAVGSVLIGEIVHAKYRGRAVGTVQSGWAVGWGMAALLYTMAFSWLSEAWAWRSLFWFSIFPSVLVLYIRRHVAEPEIYLQSRAAHTGKLDATSPWLIFSPDLLKTTLLSALLCTGVQGGYYAVMTWLPTFLKTERQLSVIGTGAYLSIIISGSFMGYLSGAYFTDRFGRRPNLFLFALLSGISVYTYTQMDLSNTEMLFVGFPLGFAASGIFSGIGAYLTELFPSSIRATGQGFAYNFGRGIGALFPTCVGYLSAKQGLGMAIGVFAAGAYALVLVTVLLLPETKGRALTS